MNSYLITLAGVMTEAVSGLRWLGPAAEMLDHVTANTRRKSRACGRGREKPVAGSFTLGGILLRSSLALCKIQFRYIGIGY